MGNPFTSIGQAKTYVEIPGNGAGNYWFDLGTSPAFQTQVDANGWVLVLDDFENQSAGILIESTDLTAIASGSSGILNSATFGEMGGIDQVRIRTFNSGGSLLSDVMNTDAGIIARVQSFQMLDEGVNDNGQADWTDLSGSNSNLSSYNLAATATTGSGNTSLNYRVFHTSGTSSGFHWIPRFRDNNQYRYHNASGGQFARGQLFVRDLSGAILPVVFTKFSGYNTTGGNVLDWTTATELNNDGFEVERSTDGRNFETIDFVKGNGTTITESNYDFLDVNLPKSTQTLYYRLKQIDTDGTFAYSQVVSIAMGNERPGATLAPNPTTGEFILTLDNTANTPVEVYDLTGRLVRTFPLGEQTQLTLDVSDLNAGMYLLRAGSQTHRFVKR